jgi:hypothetical protein
MLVHAGLNLPRATIFRKLSLSMRMMKKGMISTILVLARIVVPIESYLALPRSLSE